MTKFPASAVAYTGIGIILATILVGPLFSPAELSWIRHSTSEQAGQQLPGAWIMRVGFLGYGIGTMLAAYLDRARRPLVRVALVVFGAGLVGTALWSNAFIMPAVGSDMREDWLHSIASGVVGTAFASACAIRLFAPGGDMRDRLAWAGLVISVTVPVGMGMWPDVRGLLQRGMFVFSFVFVAREFSGSSHE